MLLIDWGNARLKWQRRDATGTSAMRAETVTPDTLADTLDQAWAELPRPDRVACVSVAGAERLAQLDQWVTARWQRPLEVARSEPRRGRLRNSYPDHQQMGADRWIALVGAAAQHDGALVVVDAGSAITADVVNAAGQHLGGWIAPGRALMYRALSDGTAAVRPTAVEPENSFGQDTAGCVAGGIDACMRGLLQEVRRLAPEDAQAFICGGDGERLRALWPGASWQPDLVLRGLRSWAEDADLGDR
ncbi:MAG: type III pantothenate kinase [Pseudomonadota bacterium]